MSWTDEARDAARDLAYHYLDEIVEQLRAAGSASDDLDNSGDYPHGDSYVHDYIMERSYSFGEAGDLLDELAEFEEDDSGLWQGLGVREAVVACAAYTYANAVRHYWMSLVEDINAAFAGDESLPEKPRASAVKKLVEEVLESW